MIRRRALVLSALALAVAAACVLAIDPRILDRPTQHAVARAAAPPRTRRRPVRRAPATGPLVGAVPILMYHVINPPFPDSPFPGLYVPAPEFRAQMRALAAAGYHGVTLDAVELNWTEHRRLPARPIVISFDNGYRSQYTNALPVLRRLGWPAVENMQLTGLPPSQGGLSAAEIRGLVHDGWELDTQGFSHADLPTLDAAELRYQVLVARRTVERRFHVPVHFFCYPSGHYDDTVVAAVAGAGYIGATTVVPGWAQPGEDRYRLPRLRVLGGTSPAALLQLIAGTRASPRPPAAYG